MSRDERLERKLGLIYKELFDINWKLDKLELKHRKEEAEQSKRLSERELEEIHYEENDFWNIQERKMKEFNYNYGEVEERIND